MFEFFMGLSEENAISILKKDHDTVKGLFDDFRKAETLAEKKPIVEKALTELKIHTVIEEEIFYPTVRPRLEKAMMNEANEEHHVAKLLIAELDNMNGSEEHYEAKFTVLSENIEHHVKEEEDDMFPRVRDLEMDLEALGRRLLARKQELKTQGIPVSAEERLMAAGGVQADSPAKAVKNHTKAQAKKAPAKTAARKVVKSKIAPTKKLLAFKQKAGKKKTALKAPRLLAAKRLQPKKKASAKHR